MSPRDPIFWTHHNMIELCWWDWNLLRQHDNTNDSEWTSREFTEFVDENGDAANIDVATMLLFPLFSYQYDEPVYDDCSSCAGSRNRAMATINSERDAQKERTRLSTGSAAKALTMTSAQQKRTLGEVPTGQGRSVEFGDAAALRKAALAGKRVMLRLSGVDNRPAGEIFVRVFINKADASPDTPTSSPHYAGSFAFFGHGPGHGSAVFNVELTQALRRLPKQSTLTLQLVVVPFPGAKDGGQPLNARTLQVGVLAGRSGR